MDDDTKAANADMTRKPISSYFDDDVDGDMDPRADKPWPADQDCPGCNGHVNGPHRFTCYASRKHQVVMTIDGSKIKF